MPTINPIFDGTTPVDRLPGQPDVTWFIPDNFMGYYSVYDGTPGANLIANASFTGSNWTVAAMRFGANGDNTTNITDSATGTGRKVDYLKLGQNSDVDLANTRVKYIEGGDGAKHDIQLGSQFTNSINIGADLNIVKTGSGYLGNLEVWNGRGIVTVNGNAGAINLNNQNDRVIIDGGDAKIVSFRGGEDRLILKNGAYLENANASSGDFIARLDGGSRVASLKVGDGDADIEIKGDSRIDSLQTYDGDVTLDLLDTAGIFQMKLDFGNHTITTADGFITSIWGFKSDTNITLGTAGSTAGGADSIMFFSGTGQAFTHNIVAHGYLGSLQTRDTRSDTTDDQTTNVTLNYAAGTLVLGNGGDTVTTGDYEVEFIKTLGGDDTVTVGTGGSDAVRTGTGNDTVDTTGYVSSIMTGDGNDTVKIGAGGGGLVRLGDGDDTILVSETDPTFGLRIQGGDGVDEIDFKRFDTGVTFDLDSAGVLQNVAAPGGDLLTPAEGYFGEVSIENLSGTAQDDHFTGDDGENVLNGRGGDDMISGGDGDDTMRGGTGKDKLQGQKGRDELIGGGGNDVLTGGKGNDRLRGDSGKDVFVFGKKSGTDRIEDFTDGKDTLRLVDHTGGFNDLTFADVGNNLKITHDNGRIILLGEAGTVLTAADFDFV